MVFEEKFLPINKFKKVSINLFKKQYALNVSFKHSYKGIWV